MNTPGKLYMLLSSTPDHPTLSYLTVGRQAFEVQSFLDDGWMFLRIENRDRLAWILREARRIIRAAPEWRHTFKRLKVSCPVDMTRPPFVNAGLN